MRQRVRFASFTVACALVAVGCLAHAAPLAYDGFADGGATPGVGQYQTTPASTNGKDNNSIFGQGPALTGFDGGVNWTGTAFAAHVYFRAEGGGLTYVDGLGHTLDTTPGQVNLFRSTPGSYTKEIGRDSNDTGAPPGVMYFSALMQFQNDLDTRVRTQWGSKTSIGIGFDASGHAEIGTGGFGNVKGTSAATFADGVPHLVVGKIVEGAGGGFSDAVTLYVDPVDLAAEAFNAPTLANVSLGASQYVAGNASYSLAAIHLAGDVVENSSLLYDEIRVAPTWAEVVPSDAPAALVLRFQQGVSPDASYVADSTTVRSDRATTPQDNDSDGENIVGRVGSAFMRGLFEFDLAELDALGAPVGAVELLMTTRGTRAGAGGALTVNLYDYGFDFDEALATWSDPDGDGNPATGDTTPGGALGNLLTSVTLNPAALGATVTFDSTPEFRAAVEDALAASDNTLRLIATRDDETGSGNHFVRFWDEQTAEGVLHPELVITIPGPEFVIPEPTTLALLALGLLGCARRRRRRA